MLLAVVLLVVLCLFIVWIGRQSWATCFTATHGSASSADFILKKETMQRLAGFCALSSGNSCYLVDL